MNQGLADAGPLVSVTTPATPPTPVPQFAPPIVAIRPPSGTLPPISAGAAVVLDASGYLPSNIFNTITTSGIFTSDNGTSLPDSTVWADSYFRVARPLSVTGSSTVGSANEWVGSFQADIPSATSSAASYEKAALTAFMRTQDPSDTTTPVTRDAVGADIRGWIDGGISTGRVWGAFIAGQTESGSDGQVQGLEVDVVNKSASDVSSFSGNTVKCGISIVAAGTQNSTGAMNITAGAGVTWHKGIRFAPGAMSTGTADSLLELDNTFFIGSAAGKIQWGSGSALDASLYRQAAATLETDSLFQSKRSATTDVALGTYVSADTSLRLKVTADGTHSWGAGSGAFDTSLTRTGASTLEFGNLLQIKRTNTTDAAFGIYVNGDTSLRLKVTADGKLSIGTGSTSPNQILTTRQTGWTAATGTPTRTTFATSTVTLSVLAEHVKALIDDLIAHGLIGA